MSELYTKDTEAHSSKWNIIHMGISTSGNSRFPLCEVQCSCWSRLRTVSSFLADFWHLGRRDDPHSKGYVQASCFSGGPVSLTGRPDWRHSRSYMNAKLLPQQDMPTAKACNLSRAGELCKRFSSSMIYRHDGGQLCSIWPHTRWYIFSTAQILPFFSCSCRCTVKMSGNISFSIKQCNLAGFIVTHRVFPSCFPLLNKLLNYYLSVI